ncbi:biotin--[acetyl-CoA-carboxylase] ligase [Limisphaera ngatamarikiensis]|uniref:Bifunctional ligase/repressor BirA n=1 Tax=Limisphaera ngatamarikiensis TaxID=1324935 RepID=A0A6M1RJS6_9BACT|nr:biotin--[acetyl-CoA-carboxylase] ligase [Limisphaera ngatamarikiensis]NGO40328.1 biotin--[acetyl-CoA-carboxylase] ligase [Limisphaera ngatamarikiensis]
MTTDARILAALHAAGNAGVSGADLAEQLGITRAAVWSRIQELRALGFEIEASPHHGYRLIRCPDRLIADDLWARLAGRIRCIGRDIRVFACTSSTNDVAEKLALEGAREGVVIFAEEQTRGRGRLGRSWVSPAGKGLWFSILLRPPLRTTEATQITVAAAVAVCRALRQATGLPLEIKWPNDITCRGRKVVGILTEMSGDPDTLHHVVLGIGVDVNLEQRDFPAELRGLATSLRIELGQPLDRPALAAGLLEALDQDYRRICDGEFRSVAEEWARYCSTLGRHVTLVVGSRRLSGRAEALDDSGALLLRTEHGLLERIIGGDVTTET